MPRKKLDVVLNMACRAITGCLKQSLVDDLYLLCGIAPPAMVRASFSQIVRTKHEGDPRHSTFLQEPTPNTLKSSNNFLHAVKPLDGKPHSYRIDDWSKHLASRPHKMSRDPEEYQPKGVREPCPTWQCISLLGTRVGRCRHLKWGYG